MDTPFYRGFVTSLTLVIAACSSPAEPAPSGPVTTGGSAGSTAGTTSQGGSGGSGGVTTPTAGSAGTVSSAGMAGTNPGGSGGSGGSVEQGGSGGSGGSTVQLPEGVPANYTLLLDEPFATEAALDSLVQGNPGGWTFDSGESALQFNGTGYAAPGDVMESLSSFAVISTVKFSSFVLEVELKQLNPDTAQPHRDICIVFNAINEAQFLYAHIAQTHDERSHNIHLIDHAPRVPLTEDDNGGIQWGTDEWHKVRLTRDAVSGAIAVYWDDDLATPIIAATSTAFTEGYIGFGTFMDSGKIRNLKIWAETSANVPAENFFGG